MSVNISVEATRKDALKLVEMFAEVEKMPDVHCTLNISIPRFEYIDDMIRPHK